VVAQSIFSIVYICYLIHRAIYIVMRGGNGVPSQSGQLVFQQQNPAQVASGDDGVIIMSEQRVYNNNYRNTEEDVLGNTPHRRCARQEENVVDLTEEPDFEVVSSTVVPRPLRARKSIKKKARYDPILQHMMSTSAPVAQEAPQEPKRSAPVCGICMEPMGPQTERAMAAGNCGHVYCKECLKLSVKKTRKCPTCRKSIQTRHIRSIFLDLN